MKKILIIFSINIFGNFLVFSQIYDQEFTSYKPPLISAENFIFSNSDFKWQPKTSLVFLNFAKLSGAFNYQLDALTINNKYYTVSMSSILENSDPTYTEANYYLLPFGIKIPLFNTQKMTLNIGSNFYLFPMNNSANANNDGLDFKFPTFIDNQMRLEANYFFGISAFVGYRIQLSQYIINNITTKRIIYTGNTISGLYAGVSCNLEVFLPIMNPHAFGKCFNQGREDWFATRNANTEAAYDDFVAKYTPSPYSEEASNCKEYLVYTKAINGSIVDCNIYLENYKMGKYTKEVLLKKEEKYLTLIKQVFENPDSEVRFNAVNQIEDQYILLKVAMTDIDYNVKLAAFNRITDQSYIYKLAVESKEPNLGLVAVKKITDQIKLMNISQKNDNWDVRKAAFKKLNDNSLDLLTREAEDPALALSAKISLGRISWNEAFSEKNNKTETLNHIIGAAAIVDSPQPTSDDVVQACHNFIKLGDASRIPELVFLLNKFGDKYLAEDYMNCGEFTLSDAGCAWGKAHGYSCTPGNYGSNRVRWGSK
jgi:hypothetical protein